LWTKKREMGDEDENNVENTRRYEKSGVWLVWLDWEDLMSVLWHTGSVLIPVILGMVNWLAHEIISSPGISSWFAASSVISLFLVFNSTITQEHEVKSSLSISPCHDEESPLKNCHPIVWWYGADAEADTCVGAGGGGGSYPILCVLLHSSPCLQFIVVCVESLNCHMSVEMEGSGEELCNLAGMSGDLGWIGFCPTLIRVHTVWIKNNNESTPSTPYTETVYTEYCTHRVLHHGIIACQLLPASLISRWTRLNWIFYISLVLS
jgi:hypothetical protein